MSTRQLNIAMVGSGGDGVITIGDMIAQAAASTGLHVFKTESYGPQIRGGESSCTVRVSAEPIFAPSDKVDVLVVFNWADFSRFRDEILPAEGSTVFYEESDQLPEDIASSFNRTVPVPFLQIAKDVAGTAAAKNIVTLGLISERFNLPVGPAREAVIRKFSKKKAEVLEANMKGFDAGVEFARSLEDSPRRLEYQSGKAKMLMGGNEAVALGALHAGCRFFAGYPITPSSEVLHMLAEWMPKVGGSLIQTEDELSAIGAVVGGSFAGVKSMTATSGPGLSLMSETLGLASVAEVPVVVVNVQRGGPSTGIPTKSEQSDLNHAIYGSHGDTPRVVLACADVEDAFHSTVDAFNIAEEFQMPVILLSDQTIGQRRETLDRETLVHDVRDRLLPTPQELEGYSRYKQTPTGVSPMSIPGTPGGMYQTNGLEHNEDGSPSAMYSTHEEMNAKRYRKLEEVGRRYRFFRRYGPEQAELGILCWGSSKGPVKEAIQRLNDRGRRIAAFVPQILHPLPTEEIQKFIGQVDRLLVIELSFSAQFYTYLRSQLTLPPETRVYARSGGKLLGIDEVESEIEKLLEPVMAGAEVMA